MSRDPIKQRRRLAEEPPDVEIGEFEFDVDADRRRESSLFVSRELAVNEVTGETETSSSSQLSWLLPIVVEVSLRN